MRSYSEQDWKAEIQKSLKEGMSIDFKKNIFDGQSINPFSFLRENSSVQASVSSCLPFLAIQNYSDLKTSGLDEWIVDSDVGFRFRDLSDLEKNYFAGQNIESFLSQPFPFLPNQDQLGFLDKYTQAGNRVNLGWSPLSFGLTRGEILKKPFFGWEKIFNEELLSNEKISWFYLSSAPYQWAGAEPHMELAIMLSLGYAIASELNTLGVSSEVASQKISFGLSLGTDILVESSKIVALKLLWSRLAEMCESPAPKLDVFGLPSLRVFSGRDPWNNIMRMTLMSFAALLGGARGFKCIPYDVLNKRKTTDAIRVSTNIPLLLKKEGYMNQVFNPMDGSSLFSDTIDLLCKSAWQAFQEIERKGGVFEAVRSGWLQTELKRGAEYSSNQMSYLQKELVGVNNFISSNPSYGTEANIIRLSDIIDPVFLSQSPDDYLPVEPLLVSSLSYDWESLQIASDQFFQKTKQKPRVVVIRGGGPVVDKKLSWIKTILSLGGIDCEIVMAEKIDQDVKGAGLAMLVTSGEEMEQSAIIALKAQGVEKIWSFGHAKRESAIERYLDTKMNALEFVKDIHHIVVEAR